MIYCTEDRKRVLTRGEREVLIMVGRGLTNRDIANDLCMSIGNVKLFIHKICVKLGAVNRQQAVLEALRLEILNPGDIYSIEEIVAFLASMKPETLKAVAQLLQQKRSQINLL